MNNQPSAMSEAQRLIRNLIGAMIGNTSKVNQVSGHIHLDDFPPDMKFERDVMDVLFYCDRNAITPTVEAVVLGLTSRHNYSNSDTALEQLTTSVDKIKTSVPEVSDDDHIGLYVRFAGEALTQQKATLTLKQALEIVNSRHGSIAERIKRASELMGRIEMAEDSSSQMTDKERDEEWLREMKRRQQRRESGQPPGPSLKFKGFVGEYKPDGTPLSPDTEGKIPFLKWGDMTLISAREGAGKSTFGGIWAEHNAWDNGIDVLHIYLETTHIDFHDRSICRNLLVPLNYLENGPVLDNPKFVKEKAEFDKYRYRKEAGRITYLFCPGWDVYKIKNAMTLTAELARERGRGLMVILDYYNKIDYTTFGLDRAQALGMVAAHLKDHTQILNQKSPIHTLIFAQESENNGDTYAYGSREVNQYCQVYISIKRERATGRMEHPEGLRDLTGQVRTIQRPGDWAGHTTLRIYKGNSRSIGDVHVLFEGRLYNVIDQKFKTVNIGD